MENFDCFPNIHQRSLERNIGLWTVIWKQHYYSTWLQSTISVISFQIVGFLCPRIKANVNYVIFEDKTFNTYNKINMLACSILKKKVGGRHLNYLIYWLDCVANQHNYPERLYNEIAYQYLFSHDDDKNGPCRRY